MNDLLNEYNIKKNRLIEYMSKQKMGGLLLAKRSNYAWLMCGRTNRIMDMSEIGAAVLLFTHDKLYLFTTNVEMGRMKDEEINNFPFVECIQYDWFEGEGLKKKVSGIMSLNKIYQDSLILPDVNLINHDFDAIKYSLTPNEKERYSQLGSIATACMSKTCNNIEPSMSEFQVHGLLSQYLLSEDIIPALILVGSDDRFYNYRHPITTNKKIDKYVIVVTSAMKWGLMAAITRIVHFGKPSSEILKARNIVSSIDSEMILSSRPGVKYSDILKNEINAFERHGLKNEWKNHHQGGPIGYEGRYFCVMSDCDEVIDKNHAVAWNPSMRGFKSEDTMIVEENENRIITQDDNWPLMEIETDYGVVLRPDILVR